MGHVPRASPILFPGRHHSPDLSTPDLVACMKKETENCSCYSLVGNRRRRSNVFCLV